MKGIFTLVLGLGLWLCASIALCQMKYDKLLAYTMDATEVSMRLTLTYVSLERDARGAVVKRDDVAHTVLYTTSLDAATLNTSIVLSEPEDPMEPADPATTGSICGLFTLPAECSTSGTNVCFSVSPGGVCTSSGICVTSGWPPCTFGMRECGADLTMPPACGPLTRVANCTSGNDDCKAFTIHPACTAGKAACITSNSTDPNCNTQGWICQRATFQPATTCNNAQGCSGHATFQPPPAVCAATSNWDCFNTQHDLCSTAASDCYTAKGGSACNTSPSPCVVTRGIPCKATLSLFCLTYSDGVGAGDICPDGDPVPDGIPPDPMLVLTIFAVTMAGAVFTRNR